MNNSFLFYMIFLDGFIYCCLKRKRKYCEKFLKFILDLGDKLLGRIKSSAIF